MKRDQTLAAYNKDKGLKKKTQLTQGIHVRIHVRKVSEKGKVPKCHECHGSIENRGEWHSEGYQNHSRPAVAKKRASIPLQMCQGGVRRK